MSRGAPAGNDHEVLADVPSGIDGGAENPTVAVDAAGEAVFGGTQYTGVQNAYVQAFDSHGAPTGPSQFVAGPLLNGNVPVAGDAAGNFAIAYAQWSNPHSILFAQRYSRP